MMGMTPAELKPEGVETKRLSVGAGKIFRICGRIALCAVCAVIIAELCFAPKMDNTNDIRVMPVFNDLNEDNRHYIETAYMNGIMSDRGGGLFGADAGCTAAEAAYAQVWLYEWKNDMAHSYEAYEAGSDEYIEKAKEYQIWPDIGKSSAEEITQAEAAVILAMVVDDDEPNISDQTDYWAIQDDPFKDYIVKLYNKGISADIKIKKAYSQEELISRADMAKLITMILSPDARLKELDTAPDPLGLEPVLSEMIGGYEGDWSVYYEDYESGDKVVLNSHQVYSASLIKLFVIQAVYQDIADGRLSDSDSIENNLTRMITYSDNDAWSSLARTLGGGDYMYGMERVTEIAKNAGFTSSGQFMQGSRRNFNFTSVEDCGVYMHRVLSGEIVSPEYSERILDLLKRQEILYKIPAGVPEGIETANKTGELEYMQGDAAIVFAPSGTYILAVIADDLSSEGAAQQQIRDVSAAVYNYLNE